MKLCSQYHQGLYTWTRALRTLFVYTEFTKKKVFEQLMLAVACSARRRPASGEESISEWDVTWRTVKVELLFSIVSYMRLLFQLQGQYCFSLMTKQQIIHAFIWY